MEAGLETKSDSHDYLLQGLLNLGERLRSIKGGLARHATCYLSVRRSSIVYRYKIAMAMLTEAELRIRI